MDRLKLDPNCEFDRAVMGIGRKRAGAFFARRLNFALLAVVAVLLALLASKV